MSKFKTITFTPGITLGQFINSIEHFDTPILYDISCHNAKNRFSVTFGYHQHKLCSEGSYTSALYTKACNTHITNIVCRSNYTTNIP